MIRTWSWACRPRDRCPRSATYTPGYPAAEEGPSLPEDLPRRPPVVPDGNNHWAHPSAGNQIIPCHAVISRARARARARKREREGGNFPPSFSLFLERRAIDRSMILSVFLGGIAKEILHSRDLTADLYRLWLRWIFIFIREHFLIIFSLQLRINDWKKERKLIIGPIELLNSNYFNNRITLQTRNKSN